MNRSGEFQPLGVAKRFAGPLEAVSAAIARRQTADVGRVLLGNSLRIALEVEFVKRGEVVEVLSIVGLQVSPSDRG